MLPGDLNTTVVTGTFLDAAGTPQSGRISFTPSADLADPTGMTVITKTAHTYTIPAGGLPLAGGPLGWTTPPTTGTFTTDPLVSTDNEGLTPDSWTYTVFVSLDSGECYTFSTFLPHSETPINFSDLTPAVAQPPMEQYLPLSALPSLLQSANNLSDVASASTARTNLGLGSAATQSTSAFDAAGTAAAAVAAETSRAETAEALLAPKASPALTGSPTAPTQTTGDSSTKIATDAFVATAAASAQAAAIAASLPALTANVSVSASGTLALNTVTEASASGGNLTMTLPSSVAGDVIVCEKSDSSANTVAITGNIRGAGSSTITLKLQNESEMFLGYAGSWWPVAGHKTLGSLDARYANVFSPLAFGAAGNGTTDDTTALQACAAAAVAAKGVIDLGTYTFKISSPINITTGFHMKGAGYQGGTITSSASDIFTIASSVSYVTFEGCNLTSNSGGGHVWNASNGPSMSFWKILGCVVTQNNAGKSIWYQNGGGWIDCLVDQQCYLICSGSATVSPWTMINAPGAVNSVKFSRMRCLANGASVPFFLIDPGYSAHTDTSVGMTASSTTVTDTSAVAGDLGFFVYSANFPAGSSQITAVTPGTGYTVGTAATATLSGQTCIIGSKGWDEDIVFDHITWEVCTGGAIWMTGTVDVLISMCAHWDTTATSNIYNFTQSNTGYPCRNIIVRGGRAGTVAGGVYDFYASSTCSNILIDSFGSWATPPVISSPANQTTIINNTVAGSTVPVPTTLPGAVAASGINGATAASRYAGATASGAPTGGSNAFLLGDFVVDQTGSIWICTAAGSPGTWSQVGSASGFASANDPMKTGYTATYISPNPITNNALLDGAETATYIKLRSGGYAISHWTVNVGASSGNISVAAYTDSGTGSSAQPTGGQLATSGAIACPAIGFDVISLGSTITPNLGDWAALSCDNVTATFSGLSSGSNTNFSQGITWVQGAHSDTSCTTQSGGSANVVLDASASTSYVGFGISNTNIPANTTITSASAGTSYTISANATGAASGLTCVIGPHPLPSTPSSLAADFYNVLLMKGT